MRPTRAYWPWEFSGAGNQSCSKSEFFCFLFDTYKIYVHTIDKSVDVVFEHVNLVPHLFCWVCILDCLSLYPSLLFSFYPSFLLSFYRGVFTFISFWLFDLDSFCPFLLLPFCMCHFFLPYFLWLSIFLVVPLSHCPFVLLCFCPFTSTLRLNRMLCRWCGRMETYQQEMEDQVLEKAQRLESVGWETYLASMWLALF